jgi:hypothetical protein
VTIDIVAIGEAMVEFNLARELQEPYRNPRHGD